MRAVNDYIIIKQVQEQVKSGGIIISGQTKDNLRHRRGVIISPSPMAVPQANLKEGDIIHFDKAQTFTILVDGEDRTVIRLRDIVLVESPD